MDQKSSATDGSGSDDSFEVLKENSFGDEVSKDATASFSDLRLNLNPDDKTQTLEESSKHFCTEFDVSESLSSSFVLISHESCKVSQSNCNSCNKGDDTVTKDANTLDESLQKVNESVTNEGGGTSKHKLGERATVDQCAQDEHWEKLTGETDSGCNVDKYDNINPGGEDEEDMSGNVDIKVEPFTKMNKNTSDNSNDHGNIAGDKLTDKAFSVSSDRKPDINKNDELKEINEIKEIPTDKAANDDTEAKEILHPNMIVNISKENEQSSFPILKPIEMKSTKEKDECEEYCEHERLLNEEKSKAVKVDTSHLNDDVDTSDGNSRPELISSYEVEKENKPSTLPNGILPTDHKGHKQHTDQTTTHLIKDKAALDELVVSKEPGELPGSTVQTDAPPSNATTGFKKPEIAATTSAKNTVSVAIDDDLDNQSNQYTSTPGTSTAKCLNEKDTKHVQTVPDASFKKENSLERTLEKCMAVKCIFGDVKLIKVGQLNIMDINGVKTKLPQSINKDVDLRLEKQDDGVILLTEKVCFEVKLVEERIVLNNITRRYFADPTRPLLPVENEKMCMENIDDNEQQRSTKICQDENTAGLGAEGFDNERASVNSQNINSTKAPKTADDAIDSAASSAKPKEVAAVDKPKIGDQLSREESPFKETLTDDVIKGIANDKSPKNIFDKASSKLQTVTSETSRIPKSSKVNEKDDLPSLDLDSNEKPVDTKSRSYNEKEDKVEFCLTRREDTQQTFDERTKNELLQTDEFEGKLGKDEFVAENLNAPKGLSTSSTGKTDVGTEMPYKKCMAVSCKFGDVRLIKVATLHIMDVNGTKSNLPKSVHKDKDLRLEKIGDTVFLLTGSVCFEVNFYNERLQLTNISSSFFTNSTGPTLQGETKALDRHSSENSNESQEMKIGSKDSLENSNNSVHDSENEMKSREISSLRENDSQSSESTDQDVNFSPTRGLQVEKPDFAKVRELPTGCIHVDHSDHHDLMLNPDRCSSPIENDDQESVQSSGGRTILTDIPGDRLDGKKKSTKRVSKETLAFVDSSDAAVNAAAVLSGDSSGPFNDREGNKDNCDLHDQLKVSLNRVGDDTSGKGQQEKNVQTADTGTCSEIKTGPIDGNTEKCHKHEDMVKADEICKRKQPEDRVQQRINPIVNNEVDEITSQLLALSIDGSKSAESPEQECVPHTGIPKEVNPVIRYPPNPGESNTLGKSKTTHMVPNKDALPKAKEKQVKLAFKVRLTIENKPAEIKTFTITSTLDDYMRWKFFINSPELRINLSGLTIEKSVLDINIGPTICEIVTPLENDLKVPIICQRLTDEVIRFCSHIVVKDITEHSIASTIDRKELSELFHNKGIYFEIIKNSIMIAYENYHEHGVLKMLQGNDSDFGNELRSDKGRNEAQVCYREGLPSHLPWQDLFERFSLARKLEYMFPSLHFQIERHSHGVCLRFEGKVEDASKAKTYLRKDFVDAVHTREVRIPLVGSEVFVKTNLCGLINKSLGTNALLMIEHSKPILYSLDEDLLEKATTHICTKYIENKYLLLVNSWRHADAIEYLVDTYTQLQDGVLIQVNREKTKLLVTGWKPKVTKVVQELEKLQKSQFQTCSKEEGLVTREEITRVRLHYQLRNGHLWMALFEKFKIRDCLKEYSESKDIDIQTDFKKGETGQKTLYLTIEGETNVAERTMEIFQRKFANSYCKVEVNLRIEMYEILKRTDVKDYLKRMFPNVVVGQQDDRFILYGFDRDDCKTTADKMNKMYAEDKVMLDTKIKRESLTDILRRYSSVTDGISVSYDENSLAIKIAGFKDDVRRITNEIAQYTQQDKMDSTTIRIEQNETFEFLWSDSMFQDNLKGLYEVDIEPDSGKNCFIISGTRSKVEACKNDFEEYVSKVSSEYYETDAPQNKIFDKEFDITTDDIRDKKTVLMDISVTLQSGFEYMDRARGRKGWRFPGDHKILLLNQDEGEAEPFYVVHVEETHNSNGSLKKEEAVGNQCVIRMKQPFYNKTDGSAVQRTKELIKSILKLVDDDKEEAVVFEIPRLTSWDFDSLMECWMAAFKEHFMNGVSKRSLNFILLSGKGDEFYRCLQPFKTGMLGLAGESLSPPKKTQGMKITLKKGKLNETKADVLVNTAAPDLNLKKGAVSFSLLQTAGDELQSEISKQYPFGIIPLKLAVTGGYKLQCQYVFHGALRPYDQRHRDQLLREFRLFIRTCLFTANTKGVRTIAFPAIGTGNLRYSLGTVIDEMYQTVNKYKADNPWTKLGEVLFVVFDGDHVACEAFEKRQSLEDNNQTLLLRCDTRASRQETPVKIRINVTGRKDDTDTAMKILQKQLDKEMLRKELPEDRKPKTYAATLRTPTSEPSPPTNSGSGYLHNVFWCRTDEELVVQVYQADLLNLTVDCIVNPANKQLDHSGGLAGVIAKEAGHAMTGACNRHVQNHGPLNVGNALLTTSGKLSRYGCIIHTVGPNWVDYSPHYTENIRTCRDDLRGAILSSLKVAETNGMGTIALPAVSSGIYGVPRELCVMEYVKAVEDFSATSPKQSRNLKEVHFVDRNQDMVGLMKQGFTDALINKQPFSWNWKVYIKKEPTCADNASNASKNQNSENSLPYFIKNEKTLTCKLAQERYVVVSGEDMFSFKENAVIVCSEDQTGIAVGGVAKLLLKKGGPQYQKEKERVFQHIRPKTGDLLVTGGGTTGYKAVYHAIMPHRNYFQDERNWTRALGEMITKIFDMADKYGHKTMVMSLLGTGAGNSDPKQCAQVLFDCVSSSCMRYSNSPFFLTIVNNNPDRVRIVSEVFKASITESRKLLAGSTPSEASAQRSKQYSVPQTGGNPGAIPKVRHQNDGNKCSICFGGLKQPKAIRCGHTFCKGCIDKSLKEKPLCPVCNAVCGVLEGNQPDGVMSIYKVYWCLTGYDCKTIKIIYDINGGVQGDRHPSPGKRFFSISRVAYLPYNPDGREVCALLILAFKRRLIFTIGESRTTRQEGVVTWNDIHHKTSTIRDDEFGYPDPGYFKRVKEELAAKGVFVTDKDFDKDIDRKLDTHPRIVIPVKEYQSAETFV